ncbi:MAG: inositol 2-dehydrogenase [Clostridiaceae bacterium]|nr:inositol 2-dehydrogenase [Clostridiaceae bacterium]
MGRKKIGVIGTGRIGKLHIQNIISQIPDLQIVAVADIAIEDNRKWLESIGISELYVDYRDVLSKPEVDAVIIASATDTHTPIAVDAAIAGKHIFCEKPIDRTIENNEKVMKAVQDAGVLFQTGFNRRFDHNFARIRQLVADGSVGDVQIIRVTSRDPAPPPIEYVKVSGGLFMDMMIHDFDMVRYVSGSEVKRVTALGANLVDPRIGEVGDVDTAVVALELENGALAVIDNSRQAVYGYDQRLEVFGSKGQVVAGNDTPNNVEYYSSDSISRDKIYDFFLDRYPDAYVNQFKAFARALNGEIEVPVGIVDGLRATQISLAAGQSLREGKSITMQY